jgi:5-methylcytosine-specific restriction endonuclease McrA
MPLKAPSDYLYNLHAMTSSQARRMWREAIKEHWQCQCAYCGSTENLTLDHVKPKVQGGRDVSHNVVAACRKCNQEKGSRHWLSWYTTTDNFDIKRCNSILDWVAA